MASPTFSRLFMFVIWVAFIRSTAALPASLVEPELGPPRKDPTNIDGSAFAREAASAAAAAASGHAHDRAVQQPSTLTTLSAGVDAAGGVIVSQELEEDSTQLQKPQRHQAQDVKQAVALVASGDERTGSMLMVAGTVDGQVHALDPATGEAKWSFSTGEPLVKSYQQLPGTLDEKRWLIPTLDGSMLVHTIKGLRRPGLNARLLVEQTPFLAPGGTFYTGSKVSRIFGVDAHTGEVRQVLSGDTADSLESNRRLLARSGSDEDVIWIGRNDYTVRAFDVPTGQEEWNLTIGEFVSLDGLYLAASSAAATAAVAPSAGDVGGTGSKGKSGTRSGAAAAAAAAAAAGSAAPPLLSLVATPDGSLRLKGSARTGKYHHRAFPSSSPSTASGADWDANLPAHVTSVFRVALEEGSSHTYLPMQRMQLSQSAGDGAHGVGGGTGGTAAVGMLDNGQVYAVALHGNDVDGEEGNNEAGGVNSGGSGATAGGHTHVSRGKKVRTGDGKVSHGGRASATQPLLPHGDKQRDGGDGGIGVDYTGGLEGGAGHGSMTGALVNSWSSKAPSTHHGEHFFQPSSLLVFVGHACEFVKVVRFLVLRDFTPRGKMDVVQESGRGRLLRFAGNSFARQHRSRLSPSAHICPLFRIYSRHADIFPLCLIEKTSPWIL